MVLGLECAMLLGLLCGCINLVPDPTQSTGTPVSQPAPPARLPELPVGCPVPGGIKIPQSLGILAGQQGAEELLSRVSDWANAGTEMITNEPGWSGAGAQRCLGALSEAIGQLYGRVLFSSEGDDTRAAFATALTAENLVNLRRSHAQGQGSHAEFWLQNLLGSTTSGTGRLLKMAVRVQPGDSTEPRRVEEWTIFVEPQNGGYTLVHIAGFREKAAQGKIP